MHISSPVSVMRVGGTLQDDNRKQAAKNHGGSYLEDTVIRRILQAEGIGLLTELGR